MRHTVGSASALIALAVLAVLLFAAPAFATNGQCLDCHDTAIGVTSAARVDFAAPGVELSRCAACHWKSGHYAHGTYQQCNTCHYSMPARTDFYASVVPTAYGWFSSSASPAQSPEVLHEIHANGSWPAGVTRDPLTGQATDCASCHVAAACDACHGEALPHGPHPSADPAYPGRTYRVARGKPEGSSALDTTSLETVSCADGACHDTAAAASALSETRTEEDAAAFAYAGNWYVKANSFASAGKLRYASKAGNVATISFSGPGSVRLYGLKDAFSGYARISLDGAPAVTLDMHSFSSANNSVVFDTGPLAEGGHTITVEPTGTKNVSSMGTKVYLDYIVRAVPIANSFTPDCASCHPEAEEPHGYTASSHANVSACTEGCHTGDLDAVHGAKGYTCTDCHSSADATVRTAIWAADTSCEICHDGGHALDSTFCETCHTPALRTYPGAQVAEGSKHMTATSSGTALTSYPGTTQDATACTNCHASHDSSQRADGDQLCYACHDGVGTSKPAGYSYRGEGTYADSGHAAVSSDVAYAEVSSDSEGFAAWEGVTQPTPSEPGTPISQDRLSGLRSIDSVNLTTHLAGATGAYDYQMYRFLVPQPAEDVSSVDLTWRGYGEELDGNPVSLSVWDHTLGAWQEIRNAQTAAPATVRFRLDSARHRNASGHVYVMSSARNVRDTDVLGQPTLTRLSDSSVRVSWVTRGPCDSWLDYGPTTAYGTTVGTSARTTAHSVTVSDLAPGLYHYRVRSASRDEDTYVSGDYPLGLPGPGVVDVPSAEITAPIQVAFAWTAPLEEGRPFQYRFELYQGGTLYSSETLSDVTSTSRVLNVGTYSWRVEAIDRNGLSYGYSNTDVFDLWEPGGSCPFLFTWDGAEYAFESDLNTTGMLGSKNPTGYFRPDPRDRYVLKSRPKMKDGEYELRLVEERLEVDYTDEFKLYAVDLPEGVELYAEKGERGKLTPLPPGGLHTVSDLRPPLSVVRTDTGEDVTSRVQADDGSYVQLNEDANVGFEYKTLQIDLGDVASAERVKIVMDAETQRPNTAEGLARQRTFDEHTVLEVQDPSGEWRKVAAEVASLPNAMEFARTYVFDITDAMRGTTGKVRFTYLFKTYIDMIRFDTSEDLPIEVKEMPLRSAELSYHGFDQRLGENDIHTFAYGVPGGGREFPPGAYTRYGDVTPLLSGTDDKFVVWGPGDEVAMRFGEIEPPADGMRREYVTFIDGYYKSQKSAVELAVEPMPFGSMSNFPYPEDEHYPDDAGHAEYLAEWNTRVVADEAGETAPARVTDAAVVQKEVRRLPARILTAVRRTWQRLASLLSGRMPAPVRHVRTALTGAPELHRSLNTDYVGLSFSGLSTALQGSCVACHGVHGQTVDGTATNAAVWADEGRVCTAEGTGCHSEASASVSGVSIRERFTASSDPRRHHDVFTADQTATGARIACSDCHNPHSNNQAGQVSDPDDPAVAVEPDFARYVDDSGDVYVLVGAEHDAVAPVIGAPTLEATLDWQSPSVQWTTDEPATTWVDWGLTVAYEGGSVGNDSLVMSHEVGFPAPTHGATYHYRIRTRDALGNERVSADYTYFAFAPPAVPALTPVPDGAFANTYGLSVTFTWTAVTSPDGDPVEYEFVRDGVSYGWQSETSFTQAVYGGTHTWTVRSRDAAHPTAVSAWAPADSFTIVDNSGSCPFLFVWDGEKFVFESDLNTTGKLAEKTSSGFSKPDPRDRYKLLTEPALKDGAIEMRLVEERQEIDYTDEFKLLAVDLPEGVDVYAEKGVRGGPGPVPPEGLHTVTAMRTPRTVRTDTGADVTARVAEDDEDYLVLNEDRNAFEYKTIELDLGDVENAAQVKIVMDAQTARPISPEGIALQRTFGASTILEVQDTSGQWRAVPASEATLPNAMEFARSYVFEIGPAMHDTTGKVRFTFLFKTYIDMIGVDTSVDLPIEVKEVPLQSARLAYHGLDEHSGPGEVYDFVYGVPAGEHAFPPGSYTRYGDVTPLLTGTDDKFVVWGPGDELALRFAPIAPPAEGMRREYVTFVEGYYKSRKSAVELAVEPLPFEAMSNFPYPEDEQYPDDVEHQEYLREWNTRVVAGQVQTEAAPSATVAAGDPVSSLRAWAGGLWRRLLAVVRPASRRDAARTARIVRATGKAATFGRMTRHTAVPASRQAAQPSGTTHYSVNTDLLTISGVRTNAARLIKTAAQGWASDGSAVPPVPASPGAEISSGDLAKTGAADADYWITDSATADREWNWQVARFRLNPADIGQMNDFQVSWRGHGEPTAGYGTRIAIWDPSSSSWVWLHTRTAQGTDVTLGFIEGSTPASFCLKCHDGTPPSGVVLPSGITNVGATWGSGAGADLHGARASATANVQAPLARGMSVPCVSCHDPHGNGNLYHVAESVNGRTGIAATSGNSMQQLCVACHSGSVNDWHAGCISCHNGWNHGDAAVDSPETGTAANYPNASSDCTLCHNHGSKSSVGSDYGRGVDESASACSEHYCHDYDTTF